MCKSVTIPGMGGHLRRNTHYKQLRIQWVDYFEHKWVSFGECQSLTREVGESLLEYLRNARPRGCWPEVFLTCRAPYAPLGRSHAISEIVRRRLRAAGIVVPHRGAHVFRHGFATRMLEQGHSLKAVADVLGHRHLATTFIYAKVDFPALEAVPLPWPEEEER